MRAILWFALAACGPRVVMAAHAGAKRTVRYTWFSNISGHEVPPHTVECSRLTLEETVVRAEGDRELELQIRIVDGDHPTCNVGETVRIVAPEEERREPVVTASTTLAPVAMQRIRYLHQRLGQPNGAFAFALGQLPWNETPHTVVAGGRTYAEFKHSESQTLHGTSEGGTYRTLLLRAHPGDHALACAALDYDAHGSNFEYGGWSQHEWESIVVDDGRGTTDCKM